jgi:hypothetical protein
MPQGEAVPSALPAQSLSMNSTMGPSLPPPGLPQWVHGFCTTLSSLRDFESFGDRTLARAG